MTRSGFFLLVCVCFAPMLHAQSAFQCSSGKEDMLNYFVMRYPDRVDSSLASTNANPIYTSISPEIGAGYAKEGYFVWTKGADGYPWDVKPFDKNYVYDRSTELKWLDPTTFKRFNTDMRISQRCISTKGGGETIKISRSQSRYSFYADCSSYQTADLGYVTNVISKPVNVDTGGNLGVVKTRTMTYTYACDSRYSHCGYKEVFSLGLNVGLYDWKYYVYEKSKWVLVQDSIINIFNLGQSVPMFSCPNTYQ